MTVPADIDTELAPEAFTPADLAADTADNPPQPITPPAAPPASPPPPAGPGGDDPGEAAAPEPNPAAINVTAAVNTGDDTPLVMLTVAGAELSLTVDGAQKLGMLLVDAAARAQNAAEIASFFRRSAGLTDAQVAPILDALAVRIVQPATQG